MQAFCSRFSRCHAALGDLLSMYVCRYVCTVYRSKNHCAEQKKQISCRPIRFWFYFSHIVLKLSRSNISLTLLVGLQLRLNIIIQYQIPYLPAVDSHHFLFEISRNIFTNKFDRNCTVNYNNHLFYLGFYCFQQGPTIR